ncbi:MAG: Abi family protein [Anaerovibrio sp.]|uniref:Abi family protein n=1 Tax=Anaerovibrio sp. TaxID=1872532 RepID=UPI001B232B75|nr:Abi family protein [Anaerovibrio sp.]MBO6246786.1 Abi family protein [Anaerovibrio sp.]
MSYKSIDALMRHLRDNGIAISGSKEKRQLLNIGYFHGYKGYRFFKQASNKLPFKSYGEIQATITYDSQLKSILYSKIMFIESALKSISLETIMSKTDSPTIQAMYDNVLSGYNNAPVDATEGKKCKLQQKKLDLQKSIRSSLSFNYQKKNVKITHFYNNGYNEVPLWALFEIMTMGEFGNLLSCLTKDVREDISKQIGLNISGDSERVLLHQYVYTLKDLRNAIAHNAVIFDARFCTIDCSRVMHRCLENEIGLPYVNFKTIGDYIILVCYFLKLLKMPKTEIKGIIREFKKVTAQYKKSVDTSVYTMVVHPDLESRMLLLEKYI